MHGHPCEMSGASRSHQVERGLARDVLQHGASQWLDITLGRWPTELARSLIDYIGEVHHPEEHPTVSCHCCAEVCRVASLLDRMAQAFEQPSGFLHDGGDFGCHGAAVEA